MPILWIRLRDEGVRPQRGPQDQRVSPPQFPSVNDPNGGGAPISGVARYVAGGGDSRQDGYRGDAAKGTLIVTRQANTATHYRSSGRSGDEPDRRADRSVLVAFPYKSSTCSLARGTRIGPLGYATGLVLLET